MIKCSIPIYLASKSPRRRKLLKQLGINFKSFHVKLDEEIFDGEHPIKTVKRLATKKLSLAKEKVNKGIIITADTIVVLDGKVLGKPNSKKEALQFLRLLSGKSHYVYTGFAIFNSVNSTEIVEYEKTKVTFNNLSDKEIKDYVNTGSPMDKAGAYGIQDDFGAVFVKKINGCYYNVVGMPLPKLYNTLLKVI